MALPLPADLTSLVVRSDFGDDAAWDALRDALDADATCHSDRRFAGAGPGTLLGEEDTAEEGERIGYVFVADATALRDPARPLLAVDLEEQPGRTFRVPVRQFATVSANLSIASLDFADFADTADEQGGTFRGFGH